MQGKDRNVLHSSYSGIGIHLLIKNEVLKLRENLHLLLDPISLLLPLFTE